MFNVIAPIVVTSSFTRAFRARLGNDMELILSEIRIRKDSRWTQGQHLTSCSTSGIILKMLDCMFKCRLNLQLLQSESGHPEQGF